MNEETITIDCIGDLHGFYPILPGGDLLLMTGDYTKTNSLIEWEKFFDWLKDQKYNQKILIRGNHDGHLWDASTFLSNDFTYLYDEGVEYKGFKIWGSPWSLTFPEINPRCTFSTGDEDLLKEKFSLIPDDIDILLTHSPAKYILDTNYEGKSCGSWALREVLERVQPRLHIFGHIHEYGGKSFNFKHLFNETMCLNVSHVNECYHPKNDVRHFHIKK